MHFVSTSEDGQCCIWDTRTVDKDEIKTVEAKGRGNVIWHPFVQIQLLRIEDSVNLGVSRILFHPLQTTTTFWASSDEGDIVSVDWSIKPAGGAEGENKIPEYVRDQYDSERNSRPVLSLERSPFYEDLLLTVHDFHFAIWKTTLEDFREPIFRSANTFGSHNTCGAFSPTRPGVIFISKCDGVDVWDFYDQSNKPSMPLNIATSAITFFKFQLLQTPKDKKASQFMAYGDETEGTLFLYEVPPNLSKPFENEE